MTFSEFETKRCEKLVAEFIERRRPPARLRKDVDLAFLKGQATLSESARALSQVPFSVGGRNGRKYPRYQAVGVLSKPSSRRPVAVSSPILSLVRPCFGQNCTECLAVRRSCGNPTAVLLGVTLDGQGAPNEFDAEPETN
jgi:hypothetical protein